MENGLAEYFDEPGKACRSQLDIWLLLSLWHSVRRRSPIKDRMAAIERHKSWCEGYNMDKAFRYPPSVNLFTTTITFPPREWPRSWTPP